jgi:N-acetylmuramoyl-L-alanine amidase
MEEATLYDEPHRLSACRACRLLLAMALSGVAHCAPAASVAIDVGHFLAEPGTTSSRGRAEFEFNLDLARDISAALDRQGLGARLIGADGMMEQLSARTRAAYGTDFFLAVHHDSTQPQLLEDWEYGGVPRKYAGDRYAGFSLFVSRKDPRLAQSLACASAMGAELRQAGFARSLYHADPVAGESKPFADRANGVHYYDNLVVLKTAFSPAVLFEAGVILNRDEELRMADPNVRAAVAGAVARGLHRCLAR